MMIGFKSSNKTIRFYFLRFDRTKVIHFLIIYFACDEGKEVNIILI